MSLLRSRSGGSLICTTFSRKYKSWRNPPVRMADSRSRLVAAMMRTSMRRRSLDPTGLISRSCRARSSLACKSMGRSPISSRNSVPPSGGFEQSLLVVLRSGERALDVAEQLRFDQRRHQRRTVHRSERRSLRGPGKMNRARHQLLPRPALPENQHRIFVLAHFLDQLVHPLHPRRHADEAAETRAGCATARAAVDSPAPLRRREPRVPAACAIPPCETAWSRSRSRPAAWPSPPSRSCRTASTRSPAPSGACRARASAAPARWCAAASGQSARYRSRCAPRPPPLLPPSPPSPLSFRSAAPHLRTLRESSARRPRSRCSSTAVSRTTAASSLMAGNMVRPSRFSMSRTLSLHPEYHFRNHACSLYKSVYYPYYIKSHHSHFETTSALPPSCPQLTLFPDCLPKSGQRSSHSGPPRLANPPHAPFLTKKRSHKKNGPSEVPFGEPASSFCVVRALRLAGSPSSTSRRPERR